MAVVLKSLGPIVATAIVVLFLLVSAIPLMHWFQEEGELATLAENRDAWRELGILSYRLELEFDSPGRADRAEIVVRDGLVSERGTAAGSGLPAETIEDLFDSVAAAIRSAPDSLTVSYDESYGFPRLVFVDPDKPIQGDETRITVTGFDPRVSDVPNPIELPATGETRP